MREPNFATHVRHSVSSVEGFSPSAEEIEQATTRARAAQQSAKALAQPVRLRISAGALSHSAIEELRQAIEDFPGPAEVWIELDTSAGLRRLRLGKEFRVQHTPSLRAELEHALAPFASAATA